jgi:general secretion pathway protein H
MTLIELLIALAIVAFMAAAAAPAVSSITGANARAAAGELSGAMRWLFDTAAMRHRTCRLALDLDRRGWWAECTAAEGRAAAGPALEKGGTLADEDEETLAERLPEEGNAERRRLLARSRFGEYADRQVKRRELPGSVAFSEVSTEHQREPVSKGMAYVYFFPQGQAEAARVSLTDGSRVYSVVLQPLTGRARVVSGVPEAPR